MKRVLLRHIEERNDLVMLEKETLVWLVPLCGVVHESAQERILGL